MSEALLNEFENQFTRAAAESLVEQFGFAGARAQIAALMINADETLLRMFADISAALDTLENLHKQRRAG